MARDMTENVTGSDEVRYPSLINQRESLDTALPSVLKGLRKMVNLAVKAVADPLTILALTEFIKKHKMIAISYVMTLASGYKHKRTLRVEQTESLYIKL